MSFFNVSGTAPIDWGPPPPREPQYADPLNGEVIVRDIELPADVTMTESGVMHQVRLALLEGLRVREVNGDKARCIQIHVHYPETNQQYVSHIPRGLKCDACKLGDHENCEGDECYCDCERNRSPRA